MESAQTRITSFTGTRFIRRQQFTRSWRKRSTLSCWECNELSVVHLSFVFINDVLAMSSISFYSSTLLIHLDQGAQVASFRSSIPLIFFCLEPSCMHFSLFYVNVAISFPRLVKKKSLFHVPLTDATLTRSLSLSTFVLAIPTLGCPLQLGEMSALVSSSRSKESDSLK